MDFGKFIFPFIMAVVTNSIMIVVIYFLRKSPYFANLFGTSFMAALYLVCVLRIFLPLEFPSLHVIIRDNVVLRPIVDIFMTRTAEAEGEPSVYLYILLAVWLAGTVVFASVSVYSHKTHRTYFLANADFTTEEEKAVFQRVSLEVLGKNKNICLKKTDAVNYIMVIGYFRKYVLLPVKDYSAGELEMIFRHECTHIKKKDLWIKLLVHIYCCIFWWNPFSYLLKRDLDYTLEMRCDLSATKDMSDDQLEVYFNTLVANCHKRDEKDKNDRSFYFICSELSDKRGKNRRRSGEFVKRFRALASDPPKKAVQIFVNSLVALLLASVFVFSYAFILQPYYGTNIDENEYDLRDDGILADSSNAYLVKQADGSYLFYFQDLPPVPVTREEVEQGMFVDYPILEN